MSEPRTQRFLGLVYTFRASDQAVHPANRLAGFIDAILAIAATLMVLNLTTRPDVAGDGLAHQVLTQKAVLASTALGFLWITGTWVLSHRSLRQLRGVDHYMTLLVITRALVITLIPWATSLLARGFSHADFWVGVEAVSLVILVEVIFAAFGTDYAHRRGLLAEPATNEQRRAALGIWVAILTLTVIACLCAPWVPWLAVAIILLTRISAVLPLGSDRRGLPGDIGTVSEQSNH